jgi:hypothetical protein
VPYLLNDFRSEVFGRAADGSSGFVGGQYFGESKIGEFDVACAVDDDILGFETTLGWVYSR